MTYLKEDGAAHRGSLSPQSNRRKDDCNHRFKANRADILAALTHTEAPLLSFPFQDNFWTDPLPLLPTCVNSEVGTQKPLCFSFLSSYSSSFRARPDSTSTEKGDISSRGSYNLTHFSVPSMTLVQTKT